MNSGLIRTIIHRGQKPVVALALVVFYGLTTLVSSTHTHGDQQVLFTEAHNFSPRLLTELQQASLEGQAEHNHSGQHQCACKLQNHFFTVSAVQPLRPVTVPPLLPSQAQDLAPIATPIKRRTRAPPSVLV